MKSRMTIRQKIVAAICFIALVCLLVFAPTRSAHSGPISVGVGNGEREDFDLTDPAKREELREMFGHIKKFKSCFAKADYAVSLFEQRDTGTTEAEHLAAVRAQYDKKKAEGKTIAWHIYIDYLRMVRDLHRIVGRDSEAGLRYTDANIVWDREFRWCAIP